MLNKIYVISFVQFCVKVLLWFSGHYINDVYDVEKKKWHSYNDSHVKRIPEQDVLTNRQRSGYIFFYMHK